MRVYIESTIPSYIVARRARDLIQAARQQLCIDWWELKRMDHEVFTSQVVLDEISAGDPELAQQRLEVMAGVTLLRSTEEAESFAQQILESRLLPPTADRDAAHIALSIVHRMDFLLTLNCRHIANGTIQARLRQLAEKSGYMLPTLCTPDELIGENTGEI